MPIGFKPHVNRIWEFSKLINTLREAMGQEVIDNPGWLGLPLKFHIPYLAFENNPEDGYDQIHVVKISTTGVFYIHNLTSVTGELLSQDPVLFLGDSKNEGYIVTRFPDDSIELARSALFDKDGIVVAPIYSRLLRLWDTEDVENLLSSFFSMRELHKLKIGSLKKATF